MQRSNTIVSKPEYVLKRVNDLIKTAYGNNADREKMIALEQLHNVISNKRKGITWTKVHEEVMKRHVELCIDLKDHRLVKDGLHQYRNLCQNVDPISLELVINHLIDISEKKTNEARSKADKVALAAAAKVADLEQEESPESILLSSMTDEASKQRTDREVVVPWLKFLWETYRTILELLHKNTKYDKLYHKTCEKAFKFCEEYKRTLEFRRLCEILRSHLSNLQKLTVTPSKTNKVAFEWTPDIIDMQLKTRLEQLEVSTVLEQWNEAFRIVEDIYTVMNAVKKTPKPRVMALYYEKLTRIFWVSENYLFHAYAWFKYYCLVSEFKKEIKPEDKALLASNVLLSALIISFNDMESSALTASLSADNDDLVAEKNQQMAQVLDFQANPTRQNLLAEITAKGIHREALPEISKIYEILEVDFKPLTLPTLISPAVEAILSHGTLHIYATPIQHIAILRVVQQLSKVYGTIKTQRVQTILKPFSSFTYTQIEKIMVDSVVRKQLNVRIDHSNQCLRFGSVAATAQSVEVQAAHLGNNLSKTNMQLQSVLKKPEQVKAEMTARKEYLASCATSALENFEKSSERKELIQELKEAMELNQQRKEESDRIRKEEQEKQRIDDMKRQLDEEREVREKQRQLQDELRKECERLAAEIERYNSSAEVEELIKMDANARQAVLTKAKSDYLKFKEAQQRKQSEQAKRLDFITRAMRSESSKIIKVNYEKQAESDKVTFNQRKEKQLEEAKQKHISELEEKKRLEKMQINRSVFENKFLPKQKANHLVFIEKERVRLWKEYLMEKINEARKLHARELERERIEQEMERQRLAKEESDRIARENDEKLRKARLEEEALQREREAEEERRRDSRYAPPSQARSFGAPREQSEPTNWRQGGPVRQTQPEMDTWKAVGPAGRTRPSGMGRPENAVQEPPADDGGSWARRGPAAIPKPQEPEPFDGLSRGAPRDDKPAAYTAPRPSDLGERKSSFGDRGSVMGSKFEDQERATGDRRGGFGGDRGGFTDRGFGDRPRQDRGFGDRSGGDRGFGDRGMSNSDRMERGGSGDRGFGDRYERSAFRPATSGFGDRSKGEDAGDGKYTAPSNRGGWDRDSNRKPSGGADTESSWRTKK